MNLFLPLSKAGCFIVMGCFTNLVNANFVDEVVGVMCPLTICNVP